MKYWIADPSPLHPLPAKPYKVERVPCGWPKVGRVVTVSRHATREAAERKLAQIQKKT